MMTLVSLSSEEFIKNENEEQMEENTDIKLECQYPSIDNSIHDDDIQKENTASDDKQDCGDDADADADADADDDNDNDDDDDDDDDDDVNDSSGDPYDTDDSDPLIFTSQPQHIFKNGEFIVTSSLITDTTPFSISPLDKQLWIHIRSNGTTPFLQKCHSLWKNVEITLIRPSITSKDMDDIESKSSQQSNRLLSPPNQSLSLLEREENGLYIPKDSDNILARDYKLAVRLNEEKFHQNVKQTIKDKQQEKRQEITDVLPALQNTINLRCGRPEATIYEEDSFHINRIKERDKIPPVGKHESTITLIVDLQLIEFFDHPEMLEEEKLVRELQHLCAIFQSKSNTNSMSYYRRMLDVLLEKAKVTIQDEDEEVKNDCECKKKKYYNSVALIHEEILLVVEKMVELEHKLSSLYASTSMIWKKVIDARDRQGFQCTDVCFKLVKKIVTLRTNNNTEKMAPLKQEVSESITKLKDLIQFLLIGSRHTKRHGEGASLGSHLIESTKITVGQWEEILVSIERIETVSRHRHELHLSKENNDDATAYFGTKEQKRRRKVCSELYFAKFLLGGKTVVSTDVTELNWPSYTINFKRQLRCEIASGPSSVCVQIWRKRWCRFFPDRLVCSNYLHIPEATIPSNTVSIDLASSSISWYQFAEERSCLRGKFLASVYWERDDEKKKYVTSPGFYHSSSKKSQPFIIHYLQKNGLNDHTHTIKKSYTPNTILHNKIMSFTLCYRHYFQNYRVVQEPVRHILIKERELHSSLVASSIPLEERFISSDDAEQARKRTICHVDMEEQIKIASSQRVAVYKKHLKEFIDRINESSDMYEKLKRRRRLVFEDVVNDLGIFRRENEFNFGRFWSSVCPKRRRELYPKVPCISENYAMKTHTGRLFISIVGGSNIPVRDVLFSSPTSVPRSSREAGDRRLGFSSSVIDTTGGAVTPFIQVRFQSKTYDAIPIAANSSKWKVSFDIPFLQGGNDRFSPPKLEEIQESLEIILFDMVSIHIGEGGGYYDDENTVRYEQRFLGSATIPPSTFGCKNKVQGNFHLDIPHIILGYNRSNVASNLLDESMTLSSSHHQSILDYDVLNDPPTMEDSDYLTTNEDIIKKKRLDCASLRVIITSDAVALDSSREVSIHIADEGLSVVKKARAWLDEYHTINPACAKRSCPILVLGPNGRECFVTRFIRSQAPPPQCGDSIQDCAHFVTLIPFFTGWKSFENKEYVRIWSSSQQFLNILAGNWEEHAALLANYLLFLNEKRPTWNFEVYLVFGLSKSEGNVAYVMTKNKQDGLITLMNPAFGSCFARDDESCPLIDIGCLVSSTTVYANVQKVGKPCLMDFTMENKHAWKSFSTSSYNLSPIQEESLVYTGPNKHLAVELEVDIANTIKATIRGLRRLPPHFRNDLSNQLRNIIDKLEQERLNGIQHAVSSDFFSLLRDICQGKSVYGFPLHSAFTDIKNITHRLKSTAIHQSKHPGVEFALSVKIFPYACNSFSVWVFVCALSPHPF